MPDTMTADQNTSPTPAPPDAGNTPAQQAPAPAQPAPSPAAQPNGTPNYPPSPDQGGPVPTGSGQEDVNTRGWRNVVVGALKGLVNHVKGTAEGLYEGGIPGMIRGAVDPNAARTQYQQDQQMRAAKVAQAQALPRFTDAQAAATFADAAVRAEQAKEMPEHLKLAQAQAANQQAQILGAQGIYPTHIIPLGSDKETTEAVANKEFGDTTWLQAGDVLYGYDPNAIGGNRAILSELSLVNKIQGLPPVTPQTAKLLGRGFTKVAADGLTFFHPPYPGVDKADAQLVQYKNLLATVQKVWPNSDPDKAAAIDRLSQSVDWIEERNKEQQKQILSRSQEKAGQKFDTFQDQNGGLHETTANEAAKNGFVKPQAARQAAMATPMMSGTDADGNEVAGTKEELAAAGVKNVHTLPAQQSGSVTVARQLTQPTGLFHQVADEIAALDKKNKLGPVTSQWKDFWAGKLNTDPDFQKLRTSMGLLDSALMNVHVGAKGSEGMLEKFQRLADYRVSDVPTLRAALGAEYNYVQERAMRPKKKVQ